MSTWAQRMGFVARHTAPQGPEAREAEPMRSLDVSRPGGRGQMDCVRVGRLEGTEGAVWQYTAIDVASAHCWAEIHLTPGNPSDRWTSELARRVAADLAAWGWRLEA